MLLQEPRARCGVYTGSDPPQGQEGQERRVCAAAGGQSPGRDSGSFGLVPPVGTSTWEAAAWLASLQAPAWADAEGEVRAQPWGPQTLTEELSWCQGALYVPGRAHPTRAGGGGDLYTNPRGAEGRGASGLGA